MRGRRGEGGREGGREGEREGGREGGMENMKDGWRAKDGQKNKYG